MIVIPKYGNSLLILTDGSDKKFPNQNVHRHTNAQHVVFGLKNIYDKMMLLK